MLIYEFCSMSTCESCSWIKTWSNWNESSNLSCEYFHLEAWSNWNKSFESSKSVVYANHWLNLMPYVRNSKLTFLLKLYIRVFFSFLKYLDIVEQRNKNKIKCHELQLQLKRNQLRKHDYFAFIKQVNGAFLMQIFLL